MCLAAKVYVTSFAFTQMDVAPGQTVETLHARLVIVNEGPDTWTIDSRQQRLSGAPRYSRQSPRVRQHGARAGRVPVTSGSAGW